MLERITEGIRPVNHRCGPAPPGGSVDQYAGNGKGGGGGYGEAIESVPEELLHERATTPQRSLGSTFLRV